MIACVSVPYFAAAVERRALAPLAATPLAIGGQPWEAKPIYAFSQEVARVGVKAGMTLRLAHVLSPQARFLPATRPRYAQASGEIVDVLLDFAPDVEPQELWHPFGETSVQFTVDGRYLPARYYLDFDGLPPRESLALAQEMGRFLRGETRFSPAIGLAQGRFAAQVAATISRPDHARLVEPGDDADFLATRSIDFLPLEGEMLRRLQLLGIGTLGALAALPRAALLTQFGPAITPFHRLAAGQAANPLNPVATGSAGDRRHEQLDHTFEPAVVDRLVLEAVVRRLAGQLAARLQTAGQEARQIYLAWELEDGRRDQSTLALRRASAEALHLTEAWLDLLAGLIAGWQSGLSGDQTGTGPGHDAGDGPPLAGLTRLTLGSRELAPAAARQLSLFDAGAARADREVWPVLRALIARHSADLFWRPVLTETDHPLPERRFQLLPLTHDSALA